MDCNIMILTETWLNNSVPDSAIELAGRYMRTEQLMTLVRPEVGVCVSM